MQNKKAIKILLAVIGLVCLYEFSFTYFARDFEQEAETITSTPEEAREWLKENSDEEIWLGYSYIECKKREINLGLDLRGGVSVTLEIAVDQLVSSLVGSNIKNSLKFKEVTQRAKELKKLQPGGYVELFEQAYKEKMNGEPMAKWFAGKRDIDVNSSDKEVLDMLEESASGAIGQAKEVLRNRVKQFGIAQPDIKLVGNTGRIVVDLPGIKDIKRVRGLLQGSANLEIWDTYSYSDLKASFAALEEKARDYYNFTNPLDSLDFEGLGEEDSLELLSKRQFPLSALKVKDQDLGGNRAGVGIFRVVDTAKVNEIIKIGYEKKLFNKRLKLAWSSETDLGEKSNALQLYALRKESTGGAYLSGEFIKRASRQMQDGKDYVALDFKSKAAGKWEKITSKSYDQRDQYGNGKPIAIVLDGLVYAAPGASNGAIPNGRTQITPGKMENAYEWCSDLANVLNAGKFPAPANIVQETFVGPTLGQQAINAAVWSFIFALCLVLIYMVFYYSSAGWAANVALVANILIIIGVLAAAPTISLTLPGVAGIVLTVGMSVDANVLIYERIREELKVGKSLKLAISDGYKHAYTAILDANITTLITGIILWYFGTSVIESFAQTLIIGIFTSLFSAIFITRLIFDTLLGKEKNIKFSTEKTKDWFTKTTYNIISSRKKFYVASGILILIGLSSIFTKGFDLGTDFSGGRTYKVAFENVPDVQTLKSELKGVFLENGKELEPEVKTGGTGNLIITTKFLASDESKEASNKVESFLYAGVKKYLPADMTSEKFVNQYDGKNKGVLESAHVQSTIADDIIDASYTSVVYALIAIFLYVAIRFRKWQFGLGALVAIFHDVIIVLGLFSLLQDALPFALEINTAFVAAVLTVVGYSINDTVVVFDRVRERTSGKNSEGINVVVNKALNSTLSRTFNTSLTILVVLLAILIFGTGSLQGFAFALLIGVIVGTYSSICIASPIYTDLVRKKENI
ncbi:MAG: protein translocase subunit SecDF [Flavobacteriales bacterium]|nr:protein translocase subunit SecDF [Flavobacteriales bacterium]|tara:strand:- start:38861 stop:41788 length:2928 start_codon:yes stop_codon:yes gene_type:complete